MSLQSKLGVIGAATSAARADDPLASTALFVQMALECRLAAVAVSDTWRLVRTACAQLWKVVDLQKLSMPILKMRLVLFGDLSELCFGGREWKHECLREVVGSLKVGQSLLSQAVVFLEHVFGEVGRTASRIDRWLDSRKRVSGDYFEGPAG
jgi:hypothetical protein